MGLLAAQAAAVAAHIQPQETSSPAYIQWFASKRDIGEKRLTDQKRAHNINVSGNGQKGW